MILKITKLQLQLYLPEANELSKLEYIDQNLISGKNKSLTWASEISNISRENFG